MKKKLWLCLSFALLLFSMTSCGSSASSDSAAPAYNGSYISEPAENAAEEAYDYDYDDEEDYEDGDYGVGTAEYTGERAASDGDGDALPEASGLYDKLVYYGNVSVDTLDFDRSVSDFKALVKQYGGYVESEQYSDGDYYEYDYSYISDNDKNHRYNATIRIPSKNYETVMNAVGNLGDVRSQDSSTENFSAEYSDLSIRLDILNQTYDRYSALMESATDEEYILELQSRMTELMIEIEQTKSRMNRIDTDVKYSYLNITIREVYKYEERPAEPETFLQRIGEAFTDTWYGFVNFLQDFVIILIHLLPFLLFCAIVLIILWAVLKHRREKGPRPPKTLQHGGSGAAPGMPPYGQVPPVNTPQAPPAGEASQYVKDVEK